MEITKTIQKEVSFLLPGIYAGISVLRGQHYGCAFSIGYNPYFYNSGKTIVMIMIRYF